MCKITHTDAFRASQAADKPKPGAVLFKIVDGVEYATLRADDFRTTMRVERAVHEAKEIQRLEGLVEARDREIGRLTDEWNAGLDQLERWRTAAGRLQAYADSHPCDHMPACQA